MCGFGENKRPALALYLLESVTVKGSMEELKTMSQTAGIREILQPHVPHVGIDVFPSDDTIESKKHRPKVSFDLYNDD